ncbi:hypothetical protein [Mesorhizobium sp. M8A.F.Ca.ET.021.01.1.1]|uniref:hypothetical protein n=1 Tax=Mesorhizobium sp. M8A.F.Ca.ET.021.01.1.1 TaxID=2496757 RepID=UPI000FCC355E|nr:hypothetical protein [Mesorhizobium sp. M8A.F.Ca.ET.021.01.1.1]RUW56370.1 hypothetical protein EOA36_04485 [Mesorhizobium sp. M8A.F.Ca.ET.021.01.1.1]
MRLTTIRDGHVTEETVPDVITEHGDIKFRWFVGLQVMSRFSGAVCTHPAGGQTDQPSHLLDLDPSEWTRND